MKKGSAIVAVRLMVCGRAESVVYLCSLTIAIVFKKNDVKKYAGTELRIVSCWTAIGTAVPQDRRATVVGLQTSAVLTFAAVETAIRAMLQNLMSFTAVPQRILRRYMFDIVSSK